MKFKLLTIKNIGSIESKTIDFTASPLGNAPLFLISGPTGSGKSIILDAVCLALYGKAVRLEKVSNRENYMDPQFNCTPDGSISLKRREGIHRFLECHAWQEGEYQRAPHGQSPHQVCRWFSGLQ